MDSWSLRSSTLKLDCRGSLLIIMCVMKGMQECNYAPLWITLDKESDLALPLEMMSHNTLLILALLLFRRLFAELASFGDKLEGNYQGGIIIMGNFVHADIA